MTVAAARSLGVVWGASLLVLAGAVLSSFRLGFGGDLATLVTANGGRVMLGAAAGAAFALGSALRLSAGALRPLADLQLMLAAAVGAAAGGLASAGQTGTPAVATFVGVAALAAALAWWLVGRLDRPHLPRRWTNLVAALALVVSLALAAGTSAYGRARGDGVVPLMLWMLGDLGRADAAAALALLVLTAALVVVAVSARDGWWETLALVSLGVGLGAAGPLPFVGAFAARAVGRLAPGASRGARLVASAVGGAAVVVAIDAVARLLIGGYAFPFLVPAGMLALPVFLTWNRARLRAAAGRRAWPFEAAELVLIAILTGIAMANAISLTRVVQQLT